MKVLRCLIGVIVLIMAVPAPAASVKRPPVDLHEMSSFNFTSRFTFKVVNDLADVFSAHRSGGHGTGFLVGFRKGQDGERVGVVFTNNHVVAKRPNQVQAVSIAVHTDTELPETISCKVVYRSQIHDFAVLEFPVSELGRAKKFVAPALLPDKDSPLYNYVANHRALSGREVLAQGNPLDSEGITTYGRTNGIWRNSSMGAFIQTQTPINPGNSGGPLIDVETLQVIGMNTLKIASQEADNVGFSIPIGEILDEYQEWLKNPEIAKPREMDVRWGTNPMGELAVTGAQKIIAKAYPEFFTLYDSALRVHDAAPETGLQSGDQIVKVAGELMPPSYHELRRRMQRAAGSLTFEIVRNRKLITVEVPVRDSSYAEMRADVDFVYLSGLLFRSITLGRRWQIDHNLQSTVVLTEKMMTSETVFGAMRMPDTGSLLIGINIAGKDYPIRSMADFKAALNQNPKAKFVRLDVREPIVTPVTEDGEVLPMPPIMAVDTVFGNPAYRSSVATYVVPLLEVVTPFQFSKHKFEEQFSFHQEQPETRDWRKFVDSSRRPSCFEVLTPKAEGKGKAPTRKKS